MVSRVVRSARLLKIQRGGVIFRQGERGDRVFRVIKGGIKLERTGRSGRSLVLRLAGPDALVGESMAYAETPIYPATAVAFEQSVVEAVSSSDYRDKILSSPILTRQALARMTERSFAFLDSLALIRLENARFRVITWLANESVMGDELIPAITLPAPKAALGSLLGLSPECFSRVLSDLREEELIEVKRKKILITNPRRLLSLYESSDLDSITCSD